jgi:hypothetical protein
MTMNVTARHHHPMSDRLDPAPYAEQARQLRALASRARAAYEEKLIDDGARLGLERDKAARSKSAAEQELAAAKLQSKRELGVADQADKAAAALERRATQTKGTAGEELREQAAEQRARAEIARRRAHAADDDAESLQFTVGRHHQTAELLETQMKSNDDMKRVEREIDHLETHADVAEGTARAALRADELQQRLSDAAARGDKVLVKQLSTEIDRAWETAHERAQQRVMFLVPPVDTAVLTEIGIDVPPAVLQVPGYTPPPLPSDPPTSMSDTGTGETPAPAADPTFDAAPRSAEVTATPAAPAADDVLGDDVLAASGSTIAEPVVAAPEVAAQAVEEPVPAEASVEEPVAVEAPSIDPVEAVASFDSFESADSFETFDTSSAVDEPAESFVDETSGLLADVS